MVELLTWVFCLGSLILTTVLCRQQGVYRGGRKAFIIVVLLAPCWMALPVPVTRLDARTLSAAALLIALIREPYRGARSGGWFLSDLFLLLIIVVITVSQFLWKSVTPLAPFDPIREMALPYLTGRLFLRDSRDIDSVLPTICGCMALAGGLALFEGFTRVNFTDVLVGKPFLGDTGNPGAGEELDQLRWGLKRAYGMETHPIYLGLTFAMMLPWTVEGAVQSFARRGPWWWRLTPLLTLGGIVATGSRAAQIASIIALIAMFFQGVPRMRPLVVLALVVGGFSYFVFREEIVDWLSSYAEENTSGSATVKIRGVEHEYSGTKHRDLLDIVYEEAVEKSGYWGYGTLLRQVPRDPDMDSRFISIDNHYLMFQLQYGYMGMAVFAGLTASVVWNLLPPFFGSKGTPGRITGGVLGAFIGCLLALRGVWFAPDFAFVWLFCAGLSVALARWYRQARIGEA
jgi:hypothetical protein